MSENKEFIFAALIAAIPSTITGIFAYLSLQQSKQNHVLINSRMTELLAATGAGEHAKGVQQGRADEVGDEKVRKAGEMAAATLAVTAATVATAATLAAKKEEPK